VAGRYGQADAATVHYMSHARGAGNQRLLARSGLGLANGVLPGPTPVQEGIAKCDRIIADVRDDRQVQSIVMCIVAQLRAMTGDFDAARALYSKGREVLRELGQGVIAAQTGVDLARVELLAGDLKLAEREVGADCDFLARTGETYLLSTVAAVLARVVREQGRDDDALALSITAEGAAAADDVDAQVQWRSVRAPILARRGDLPAAEAMARAALALAHSAEAPLLQAETRCDLAEVLNLAGRRDEARAQYLEAAVLWSTKGDIVSATRAKARAEASQTA
jgi:ATP/maltotriose-dependent transcriptional regulator MalT